MRRSERASAALRDYAELLRSIPLPAQAGRSEACVTCAGTGIFVDPFDMGRPCPDCAPQRQAERLQALSGLNPDERRVALSDVQLTGDGAEAMLLAARKFLIQPARILTLYGGSGNAKTLILQAIVNECLARGIPAMYTTLHEMAEHIREAFRAGLPAQAGGESALRRVERFKSIRVLAIDEFDKVKETEWLRELETDLIDTRYRNGLAGLSGTVIAMNSDPAELPDWIYSRLRDGRNTLIHNTDPDLRPLMGGE